MIAKYEGIVSTFNVYMYEREGLLLRFRAELIYTAKFILELGCGKIYCRKSDLQGYTTKLVVELDIEKA